MISMEVRGEMSCLPSVEQVDTGLSIFELFQFPGVILYSGFQLYYQLNLEKSGEQQAYHDHNNNSNAETTHITPLKTMMKTRHQ